MLKVKQLIIFSLLSSLILSFFNYHLNATINIQKLDTTVSDIHLTSNNSLILAKYNNSFITLSYLSGKFFQQLDKQIYTKSSLQSIKISKNDVYLKSDSYITLKSGSDKNYMYNSANMSGNIFSNTNKNYLIISRNQLCPTLTLINLTSMNSQTIKIQQLNCSFNFIGLISSINNQIVYLARNKIFILDQDNLQKIQTINAQQPDANNNYTYVDTYFDSNFNMKTFIVKRSSYYQLYTKNNQSHSYIQNQNGKIYNPQYNQNYKVSNLFLINSLKAISFQDTTLYEWQNFTKTQLKVIFSQPQEIRQYSLGISNQQYIFVTSAPDLQQIRFYQLLDNLTTTLKFSIKIKQPNLTLPRSQINSGLPFTEQDKYFIIPVYTLQISTICIIDVTKQTYTLLYSDDVNSTLLNCPSFGILNKNKLITVCRNKENNSYFISIRNLKDNFQIVNSINIDFQNIQSPDFKIMTNYNWNNIFLLQIRNYTTLNQPICISYQYQFINNQIVKKQIFNQFPFFQIQAVGKYLVFMNYSLTEQLQNYMRIYHIQNLTQFFRIKIQKSSIYKQNYIYSYGNVLVIHRDFNNYRMDFYDFSGQQINKWYIGSLMRRYYPKYNYYENVIDFVLVKRQIYLVFNNYFYKDFTTPSLILYNLQYLPIKKIVKMQQQNDSPSCYLYINGQSTNCPLVFYIVNKTLNKFSYCKQNKLQKFDIYPQGRNLTLNQQKLILSSSKNYIIAILIRNFSSVIQIRSVIDPSKLIYRYSISQVIYNVDYTSQGLFIYNSKNFITINKIDIVQPSSIYNIDKYNSFDINQYGCIITSGYNNNEAIFYLIYRQQFKSTQFYSYNFSSKLDIIKISEDCKMIATYKKQTNLLQIWQYNSKLNLILSYSYQKLISLRFVNNSFILIQEFNGLYLFNYRNKQAKYIIQGHNIIYDLNKNGSIIATSNQNSVQVTLISSQILKFSFFLPNNQIVTGVTFGFDDTILISSQMQKLYSLSPTPCPQTYISINLICTCKDNQTEYMNKCQCKKNFNLINKQCICPPSFSYQDYQCNCKSHYISQGICMQCSFPCQTCNSSSSNCQSYVTSFYVIIVGSVLLGIGIILIIILKYKRHVKKNQSNSLIDSNQID